MVAMFGVVVVPLGVVSIHFIIIQPIVIGTWIPWTVVASVGLGGWLMFTRLVFGTAPPLADSDHPVGALVVTVAVIATAEVARPL